MDDETIPTLGTIGMTFFTDKECTIPIPANRKLEFKIIRGAKLPIYLKNTGEVPLRDIEITADVFNAHFEGKIAVLLTNESELAIVLKTDKVSPEERDFKGEMLGRAWPVLDDQEQN